jgi:phosphohistidine swiveling domain-containing protein
MTKVDAAARNAPCLSREQLRELAGLAVQVRALYSGTEQDIEWALRDGKLYLLQTRPITTRPAAANTRSPFIKPQSEKVQHGSLWTRMDIGEIFVGLMTPLGLSFARYHQTYVHAHSAAAVGVRDTGDYVGYMGYLQGHVYLNTSYTSYLLGQCLPTRDQRHFTDRFVSEEVDLSDYKNPYGKFPGGVEDFKSTTYWLKHTVVELLQMRQRAGQMVASRLREFDRARSLDLTRFTRTELHAELTRYLDYYYDMHVGYMPYYINAFGAYGLLTELCAQWLGHAGENLQNRIKTDMSSLRTVASAREIWTVAQGAKDRPGVLAIIRESPLEQIEERLRADEDGLAFWNRHMEPFLRDNGVRSRQEMELTHPRWVDDPSYLFQMIRRYADDGFSIDEILQRSRGYNEHDATAVLDTLPRSKRTALEKIIALYSTCSELRETTRMAMVTSLWLIRNMVYEVGRRLVEQGLLHSLDEVAYLDFEDVRAYLRGAGEAHVLFAREKTDEARRLHEHYNRLPEPPLTFVGEYDPADRARPAAGGPQLRGLGASPGRVVGRARIIEDLVWQADEFQVGEILVTRYTDASWTPLFAIAGGVVTDIGSMLSHSSIVSREFIVPSVVNTKHATERINTGDMVRVDGDTGLVEVVEG